MSDATVDALGKRLERLERENRRLKQVGILVLALIVAGLLMGQAKVPRIPKVLEAEKFILRGPGGMALAELGSPKGEVAALEFREPTTGLTGSVSAGGLILSGKGSGTAFYLSSSLLLFSADGLPMASLEVSPVDGHADFRLQGKGGKSGVVIDTSRQDAPRLSLQGKGGIENIVLGFNEKDAPFIAVNDEKGKTRVATGMATDGTPGFMLQDEKETSRAFLYLDETNTARLEVIGRDQKTRDILSADSEADSRSRRTWVLWGRSWGQTSDLTIPLGAWHSRSECEAERIQRDVRNTPAQPSMLSSPLMETERLQKEARITPDPKVTVLFTCLPDNVDPRTKK